MLYSNVYGEHIAAYNCDTGKLSIMNKNFKFDKMCWFVLRREYNCIAAIKIKDTHYILMATKNLVQFVHCEVCKCKNYEEPILFHLPNGFAIIGKSLMTRIIIENNGNIKFHNVKRLGIKDQRQISPDAAAYINRNGRLVIACFPHFDNTICELVSHKKVKYFIDNLTFVSNLNTIYTIDGIRLRLNSHFPINYFESLTKADVEFQF